ncbi:MAG: pyruvate formate lyase family protein [Candidatus Bathyarchaeota archaeon]
MSRVDAIRRNLDRYEVVETPIVRSTVLKEPGVEAKPVIIRKALALERMLEEAPVHIYPHELIVGIPFRERPSPEDPSKRLILPESVSGQGYTDFANKLIALGHRDATYHPVIQCLSRYGGSDMFCVFPHYATSEEVDEARRLGLDANCNPGHLQGGHAQVIKHGWSGLRNTAEDHLSRLSPTSEHTQRQAAFLEAVIITLQAAQGYAHRYAQHAEDLARKKASGQRRSELAKIAEVCRNVAVRAPQTWWEALQLNWFTHLINHTQGAHQLGRFDQYMWPVLRRQLERGETTMDEAQELLECLWLKFSTYTAVDMDNLQNIIIGGMTPDGGDATNPLSYMCLEATDKLGTIDPKWSIRVHKDSPQEFLSRAAEIIKKGGAEPGIYNDEIIIKALTDTGVPLEDARDYTNDGCSEILVQGSTNPWAFEARVKLLKCLESTVDGIQDLQTFEELYASFKDRVSVAVSLAVSNANVLQEAVPRISPNPWISAGVEGCLEKMMDVTEGGAKYNSAAVCVTGLADAVDSLAALKKLVYEDKLIAPVELLKALKADFEGHERMRQLLLNRAPKFGNDDDYVDSIATDLVEHLHREVTRHRNPRGGGYVLGLFSYGDYIGHGLVTGATPNGRRSGDSICPNFSPSPGRDKAGPWAAMKSTAKVNQALTANGNALDLTIHPSAFTGPQGTENLVSLIRAFNSIGGIQVQFNIVDSETLKAAQREPEKYQNLTVRLWGFPAYFTRLPREFQEHLIARSEHKL